MVNRKMLVKVINSKYNNQHIDKYKEEIFKKDSNKNDNEDMLYYLDCCRRIKGIGDI